MAQQAIAYQQSVFCAEEANWPNFRPTDNNGPAVAYMRSWCHDAPGTGLARIGSMSVLNNKNNERVTTPYNTSTTPGRSLCNIAVPMSLPVSPEQDCRVASLLAMTH